MSKICVDCKISKLYSDFSKRSLAKDGLDSYCKLCRNAISKQYAMENREKRATYTRNRRQSDLNVRLANTLRCVVRAAVKSTKSGSAVTDLGCSVYQLKSHLESLWTDGMSWENYGNGTSKWNIDHMVPLSSVDLSDRESFLKVCNYINLRPMWYLENIIKGRKVA